MQTETAFRSYTVVRAARASSLTPSQNLVLVHMAHRAGEGGHCWASIRTLASDTGLSERTVQAAIKVLAALGVLELVAAGEHRTRTWAFHAEAIPPRVQPLHPATAAPPTGNGCTPDRQLLHPTGAAGAPEEEAHQPTPEEGPRGTRGEQRALPLPPRLLPSERFFPLVQGLWDAQVRGYVWTGADRARLREWISALGFDADVAEATRRLGNAIGAYVVAANAGRAWPKGDPPTTRWFTNELGKWVQVGDRRVEPPESPATDPDEDIVHMIGREAYDALHTATEAELEEFKRLADGAGGSREAFGWLLENARTG